MITISLASGQFLRITPNHPILTKRGWIETKLLRQGDDVICHSFPDGTAPGMNPNKNNMPTLIEEIPSSLGMSRLASVPSTAKDFHGDGMESDVYVVWSNSLLRSGRKATGMKPFSEKRFGRRDTAAVCLSTLGNLAAMIKGLLAASAGLLGNLDATVMFLNRYLFGQQAVGFYLATPGNALNAQSYLYDRSRNTVGFRQSVFRFTSEIPARNLFSRYSLGGALSDSRFEGGDSPALSIGAEQPAIFEGGGDSSVANMESLGGFFDTLAPYVCLDSVLEINISCFDGHVYNLQTAGKWYNAGNSIQQHGGCVKFPIVHNCSMLPITPSWEELGFTDMPETRLDIEAGESWFGKLTETAQRGYMGDTLYEGYKAGAFDFSQLVKETYSPAWGRTITQAAIKDVMQ